MRSCPDCGQACACDGEDVWNSYAAAVCCHVCEEDHDDDDPHWDDWHLPSPGE